MLLVALEDGPLSTFELFDCLWSVYEDASAEDGWDCGYRDWTRGGVYTSMLRLEKHGFVSRCEPRSEHRKKGVKHGLASVPASPLFIESKSLPPRYEWMLTSAGRAALEEAA